MPACHSSQDCCSVPYTPQQAAVHPRLCQRSWTPIGKSGSVLCGVSAPFSWVLVHMRFFFVPFNSLFPQACASSVIKSHWSPKSNSMCSQSLCQTPRLGNLLWVLELLQQCENFFGYNCSPVCGSSSQWLCGGAKGNLLARQLMMCAMPPRSAAARTPVPMAGHCRRHSNTQHRSDSVSVGSPYCKIQT